MHNYLINIVEWIKNDYKIYPLRFIVEVTAWALSIGCAITLALTVPNTPFIIIYPIYICYCCMFSWAAYSRQSVGMLANYALLITIDSIGLVRVLTNS